MRLAASEKMETIRRVENSDLPLSLTLQHLGIARSTFSRWYKAYLEDGYDGLLVKKPRRGHWNKVPQRIRERVVEVALAATELSPREIACQMTDREGHFLSESSVYRILKSYDLITSPAYILMEASDSFRDQTSRPNEMWQTDFTHLLVVGWGASTTCPRS
ncbi:MAG: putative transposase [Candidatus Binatia bacterium]